MSDQLDALFLGQAGPIVWRARFERVAPDGLVRGDLSPAVIACDIDADEDRAIYRTARLRLDPLRPEARELSPLSDLLRVTIDVLVGGDWVPFPSGLYALAMPRYVVSERGVEEWEIEAPDVLALMASATTTATYAVPAGANVAAVVADIVSACGLVPRIDPIGAVTATGRQWPAGTSWLDIVNELLQSAGCYSCWADATGAVRGMRQRDLSTVAPAVRYGPGAGLVGEVRVEAELTRLANRVIAVGRDPQQEPIAAVAENHDPRSPLSIERLGRVYTKVLEVDASTEEELAAAAQRYLDREAGLYRRASFATLLDPRRDAHEVVELDAPPPAGGRWWTRGHRLRLEPGALMEHEAARVIIGGLE